MNSGPAGSETDIARERAAAGAGKVRGPRAALWGHVVKRVAFLPVGLLIVITVAFFLVNILPGDPARVIAGGFASEETLAEINAELGLDQPLLPRFGDYMTGLVRGDMGDSFETRLPVRDEVLRFLPATVELVLPALILAALGGIALGTLGAYYRGRAPDKITGVFVSFGQAIPDFFLGIVLIYVLFFRLGLTPGPEGRLGFLDTIPESRTNFMFVDAAMAGEWATFRSLLSHSILPWVTLAVVYLAYFARTTRSAVSEALQSQQVQFARACGLPERTVLRYAFLEARRAVITFGGILFAALVGGAAIVETVFSWNGFGQWGLDAMLRLDMPVILGFVVVSGIVTLVVFLVLDLLILRLDPRVTYQ